MKKKMKALLAQDGFLTEKQSNAFIDYCLEVTEEIRAKRAEKIKEIARNATSYKECLIAAMEYGGWTFEPTERVYIRRCGGHKVDPFFLEAFAQDQDDAYITFFGKDVYEMSIQAWDSIKAVYALRDLKKR